MKALAFLLLAAAACTASPYRCTSDDQCVVSGVHGRCAAAGQNGAAYCAFPDGKCPITHLSWDQDSTPAEISNQCVPPESIDGGTTD